MERDSDRDRDEVSLIEALGNIVRRNPRVRDSLRVLATEFLTFLNDAEPPTVVPMQAAAAASPIAAPVVLAPVAIAPTVQLPRETVQLQMGGAVIDVQALSEPGIPKAPDLKLVGFAGPTVIEDAPEVEADEPDLKLIAKRSHLKAQACRWSIERRRRIDAGDEFRDFADGYRDLVANAKALPNCYLWMIDPRGPTLPDDETMQTLAGCYDTLAQGAELVIWLYEVQDAGDMVTDALYLLAEAQSALRAGLLEVLYTGEDQDQRDTFWWLRNEAFARRIFIDRFMRVDDIAEPIGWLSLQGRISALRESVEQRRKVGRERSSLLNKVRYHAAHAAKHEGDASSQEDWRKMAAAIETMVTQGMPASNVEVRELLLPLVENVPELEFGAGMSAVLEEIDRYLSTSARPETAAPAERQWGKDVARVAGILRGRKMLLVGGHRRPQAQKSLEQAFELEELIWPSTDKHESLSMFEPDVAKPAVAVVIMAIRWSSHSYGELKDLCDKYGKPFVRLKAGYNANQVAHAILEQAEKELTKDANGS